MSEFKIEAGTAQHVGNRPAQHDRVALYTSVRAPGYVLAVLADGGERSAMGADQALHTAKQLFDEYRPGDASSPDRIAVLLREIVQETHDVLLMNPLAAGADARSTLTLLVLTPQHQAIWATVGDSRLYRFANGACIDRAGDAAYVEHLVNIDKVPLEAARKHRGSRLLANAVGNALKAPFVAGGMQQGLQPGDAFLLCSDGLWSWFSDNELAAAVSRRRPREAAELLIDKARERAAGNGDNCSMAILRLMAR
ncbi:PP2C family protein-serine/threonine phosphatase [Pseudoduganella chitinolytica]|uniref:Protein phosphatase 2C domain-containing protein n=1 Tax=Pseudoduganella chitinolytica TaxID=34070 RepID=A0ABY8BEU7_9BURK|nr:protein phosphatase 2C domain-containing protein [Pseudoduganella chitinolytica]WEF33501.1 protein phosphatase 2C domain-containing protein [Pseudoduganella chitinolytica]